MQPTSNPREHETGTQPTSNPRRHETRTQPTSNPREHKTGTQPTSNPRRHATRTQPTSNPREHETRAQLAANLRRLRIARHLSLSQLARDTSMSKATLSGIERGRGNPTIDTLALLAGALRVTVAELLEQAPLGEMRIVRVAAAHPWPPAGPGRRQLEAAAELDGSLELVELALPPRHTHNLGPRPAGARAAVFVLQGKLIAGPVERISELATGDYASFPADVPHLYEAGRAATRALVLSHTPAHGHS
jgi:transcriptional regulator with XRE-family HTH domain